MIPQLSSTDITPFLRIPELMESQSRAFRMVADGTAITPSFILRSGFEGDLHVKAATAPGVSVATVKMAGWSRELVERAVSPSTGCILVFDARTWEPKLLIQDDHYISDYRTAAAGALAARTLARADCKVVTIVGAGTQARMQALALAKVFPEVEINIWARSAEAATKLQWALSQVLDVKLTFAADLSEAVNAADIVVAATSATDPIIKGEWLKAGCHVTSVGSDDGLKCELDLQTLLRSSCIAVDSRKASEMYGNIARHKSELIGDNRATVVEIGAILSGKSEGRRRPSDITVATFSGLGIQDLLAVEAILDLKEQACAESLHDLHTSSETATR